MTTTNKYIFRLATILTLIFGVYSCSDDSSDTTALQRKQWSNPLEYIGIAHNIYMEEFTHLFRVKL